MIRVSALGVTLVHPCASTETDINVRSSRVSRAPGRRAAGDEGVGTFGCLRRRRIFFLFTGVTSDGGSTLRRGHRISLAVAAKNYVVRSRVGKAGRDDPP